MPAKKKPPVLAEFQNLLRQMFQIANPELNFGIYRVIRQKSEMIENQLIAVMPKICDEVLSQITDNTNQTAQKELWALAEKVRETIGEYAIDGKGDLSEEGAKTKIGKKYEAAKIHSRHAISMPQQNDIYNHLLQFFGYYYSDGDFMPSRRSSNRGVYSLPYNGEDVMLHWGNRGQYYVKTTERFLSYAFVAGTTKIRFIVEEACDMPENNNKGIHKFFFPQTEQAAMRDGEFTVPFQYRAATSKDKLTAKNGKGQDEINHRAEGRARKLWSKKLSAAAAKNLLHAEKEEKSALLRALESYARGNDSDFFIHKDLDAFLKNELNSYITNHILNLDEITQTDMTRGEAQLLLARAVRDVAHRIIQFLVQLENFQKVLWEKRKFITKTDYIVSWGAALENCDDTKRQALVATIVNCKEQWDEWQKLGFLEITKDIFVKGKKGVTAREKFLSEYLSVPLDTQHFNEFFVMDLLACFTDIDEATDGVLIHGENWQALNLLSGKYAEKVKCIYIDPPYNTVASEILYKNDYKQSAWLTLMENRLLMATNFLENNGSWVVAIDDTEMAELSHLMDYVLPTHDRNVVVVNHHPGGAGLEGANISSTHEYAIFMTPNGMKTLYGAKRDDDTSEIALIRGGAGINNTRIGRPNSFYAFLINPKNSKIVGVEAPPPLGEKFPTKITDEGYIRIYPINGEGIERVWRRSYKTVEACIAKGEIICKNSRSMYLVSDRTGTRYPVFSNWTDKRYNAGSHGTNLLKDFFGLSDTFSYPKSVYTVRDCVDACINDSSDALVLDFFAGSGTTAHAIINLNREDGGQRKFILVEMGEYFETTLTPRIKKIIFAPNWKDGKPVHQNSGNLFADGDITGSPRIVKYHHMESYEDALDNIQFDTDNSLFDGDYEYRYMLKWESRQCATFAPGGQLNNPFNYTLKRAGKEHLVHADLPETFNAMAGFHLQQRRIEMNGKIKYQIDLGILDGKKTALIWRDITKWKAADKRKDRDFVTKLGRQKWLSKAQIYINGDSKIGKAKSLSPKFRNLMFANGE